MKKILESFNPSGGKHCITCSLKQIFDYYGYSVTEEMLFGLGEGLDFTYINLSHGPMISGRSKIIAFEHILAAHLGFSIKIKQPKNYGSAFSAAKKLLDENKPVLVYTDMPYLPYLGLDENSHFGGHSVVLFGYDDENQLFYVSDRDHSQFPIPTPKGPLSEDFHLVTYENMEKARNSAYRPFPANNKYAQFNFTGYQPITKDKLSLAIHNVCTKMLHHPAKLKGINGINKFSKEIKKWRHFNDTKLMAAAITNYFQIKSDGGTGGGAFRFMYGLFLQEASEITCNKDLYKIGTALQEVSYGWDALAVDLQKLSKSADRSLLNPMADMITQFYHREKELLEQLAVFTA